MPFVTDAIDIPVNRGRGRIAWMHGMSLALSSGGGLISALFTTKLASCTTMILSWILNTPLFVRLYQRYQRYTSLKKQQDEAILNAKQRRRSYSHRSINALKEQTTRAKLALELMIMCTISWTGIAVSFTLQYALPAYRRIVTKQLSRLARTAHDIRPCPGVDH
jgi:hypothetical protein